jgi:hypothetical protein
MTRDRHRLGTEAEPVLSDKDLKAPLLKDCDFNFTF